MNSLRGALNKDIDLIRPTSLYNIPNDNAMAMEYKRRLQRIVDEDMQHTAGGVRHVPHYHSIMGGQHTFTGPSKPHPVVVPRIIHTEKKYGTEHEQVGEIKPPKRGRLTRSALMKELYQQVKTKEHNKKVKRFIQNVDLHIDENARNAWNQINRAREQLEYNSPGGQVPSYYFQPKNYVQPSIEFEHDLPELLRKKIMEARVMELEGGSWFSDIGDTFKKAFSKAGDILTNTPLKYIPGISTVGQVYKKIAGEGKRKRKRKGKGLTGRESDFIPKGRGLAGRVSDYPTIRT